MWGIFYIHNPSVPAGKLASYREVLRRPRLVFRPFAIET
eukprot:jgi/Botrbrau1/4709/Bobra.0218s0030.1